MALTNCGGPTSSTCGCDECRRWLADHGAFAETKWAPAHEALRSARAETKWASAYREAVRPKMGRAYGGSDCRWSGPVTQRDTEGGTQQQVRAKGDLVALRQGRGQGQTQWWDRTVNEVLRGLGRALADIWRADVRALTWIVEKVSYALVCLLVGLFFCGAMYDAGQKMTHRQAQYPPTHCSATSVRPTRPSPRRCYRQAQERSAAIERLRARDADLRRGDGPSPASAAGPRASTGSARRGN